MTALPIHSVVASLKHAYIKTLREDGWRVTGQGGRLKDETVAAMITAGTVVVVRKGDGA